MTATSPLKPPVESGLLTQIEACSDTQVLVRSTRQRRDRALLWLFVAILAITAIYNFVIATPRYASQFSYVVRSATPAHDRFSFMNFSASGESSDNGQAIIAYLGSRDLVGQINRDGLLTRIFSESRVDFLSAFPSALAGHGTEHLFRHFQNYLDAEYDEKSNISYVEVQAFTPQDAQQLAERLRQASEYKVNALNERARAGMTQAAEKEVAAARTDLARALDQLTLARNRGRVIDPKIQSAAAVALAAGLADDLATIQVEIDETRRMAPDNPSLGQLQAKRDALRQQLARESAGMAGGPGSLADRIEGSEALAVVRDAAEKRLLAASLALASARSTADRNRLYIEWISQPSRPDEPRYPRGMRNMALVAALCLGLLWIFRSLSELLFDADE